MAKKARKGKYWQKGAVRRPGALTAKAERAGKSPMQYAREHYHSPGLTGRQARYAVNAQKRTGRKSRRSSRK